MADLETGELVDNRNAGLDCGLKQELLLDHLMVATRHRNKHELNKALRDYMSSGLPTQCKQVEDAARKLDILSTRDAIKDATKDKNLDLLRKYLRGIREQEDLLKEEARTNGRPYDREHGISLHMEYELQEAKKVLRDESAKDRRHKSDMTITLTLDRNAMSEVRSYQKPPRGVHAVMQATYLLLGEDEHTTMDWMVCAKMTNPLGATGLQKRLMKFDYKKCHPEMVARARQILDTVPYADIVKASRGGACFYVYAHGVTQDYEQIHSLAQVAPAHADRQREILNRVITTPKELEKAKRAKQLEHERKQAMWNQDTNI